MANNSITFANAKKLGFKGIQKQWESLSDNEAVAKIKLLNQTQASKSALNEGASSAERMTVFEHRPH